MACLVPGAAGLLRYVQDYRMTMARARRAIWPLIWPSWAYLWGRGEVYR